MANNEHNENKIHEKSNLTNVGGYQTDIHVLNKSNTNMNISCYNVQN